MTFFRFFCLILLLLYSSCNPKPTLPKELVENIEERIQTGFNPSIGIVEKDGPQYYTFGTKTIDGEIVDEHTIYEIGSITKVFTAIILAELVRQNKMELDDPIKKYLPDSINIPQMGNQEITLAHLSDHTSSLPEIPDNLPSINP